MEELISVIIPVYNTEKYIKRCIESVLIQSYHKIEIIIVNDGSEDKSLEICEYFSKKDERIRIISQKNSGVSKARNIGIENAHGRYVCFIDADDYVSEDYISFLYDKILRFDADLATCSWSMERKKGEWKDSLSKEEKCLNRTEGLINLFKKNGIKSGPVCKLYRTDILKKYHIKFNESIKMAEDKLFCYDYLFHCHRIYSSSAIKYFYTYNSESASNKKYIPIGLNDPNLGFIALNEINKSVINEEKVVKYYLIYAARSYIRMVYRWDLFLYLSKDEVHFIQNYIKYCYRNGDKKELFKSKGNYIAGIIIIISKTLTIILCWLIRRFYKKRI